MLSVINPGADRLRVEIVIVFRYESINCTHPSLVFRVFVKHRIHQ